MKPKEAQLDAQNSVSSAGSWSTGLKHYTNKEWTLKYLFCSPILWHKARASSTMHSFHKIWSRSWEKQTTKYFHPTMCFLDPMHFPYQIYSNSLLIILVPPRIHKNKNPGKRQHDVSEDLPRPISGKVFEFPLKVNSPNSHGNVQQHTPFGKEALELGVLDKSHHEQEESNGKQKPTREGIRGLNQELIMRWWPLKLTCCLNAMAKNRKFIGAEHHESSTNKTYKRVEHTN